MGKAETYEAHAAKCLRLARLVREADHRAMLIEMARAWQKLAQQVRVQADDEKV
jgi:predicted 2-oxoglutarate/Fe(II)-dependent dioxygenase YbiX